MAELVVTEELQDYLVAQGVAQLPAVSPSTSLPSIWLAPRDGAPRPRTGENATITLIDTNLGGPANLEDYLEECFVDVIVVARTNGPAKLIHRSIRNLIHPMNGQPWGRHHWYMAALLVEYSGVWRGDQPLAQDDATYSRVASYRFGCRRKSLAGTPLVP